MEGEEVEASGGRFEVTRRIERERERETDENRVRVNKTRERQKQKRTFPGPWTQIR